MTSIEVKCRCGGSSLKITGDPVVQIYCHCDDCQAANAAAYTLASIYPAPAVEVLGQDLAPTVIKATPRMRCETCGTYMYSEIASVQLRSVNAYLLPPELFKPQLHVQCQYAVLPVVDNLPHYKGFPPAFGGNDELVGW